MEIGERLRELRKARKLTQWDIEERTAMKCCYVSRVECGYVVPTLGTLEKWVAAMDLELHQLFYTGKGKPSAVRIGRANPRTNGERNLIEVFRRIPLPDQKLLVQLARYAAAHRRRER